MKTRNIISKLQSLGGNYTITATPANWGGYCVKLSGRVGKYYDIEVFEQVHSTDGKKHNTGFTEDEAKALFRDGDVEYFCSKPYHDESDLMSDYCAWSFNRKLKDFDRLEHNAKTLVRV